MHSVDRLRILFEGVSIPHSKVLLPLTFARSAYSALGLFYRQDWVSDLLPCTRQRMSLTRPCQSRCSLQSQHVTTLGSFSPMPTGLYYLVWRPRTFILLTVFAELYSDVILLESVSKWLEECEHSGLLNNKHDTHSGVTAQMTKMCKVFNSTMHKAHTIQTVRSHETSSQIHSQICPTLCPSPLNQEASVIK